MKTTKETVEKNMARNTVFDRVIQGIGIYLILALAFKGLLPYIKTTAPISYCLVAGVLAFLLYAALAPIYRK